MKPSTCRKLLAARWSRSHFMASSLHRTVVSDASHQSPSRCLTSSNASCSFSTSLREVDFEMDDNDNAVDDYEPTALRTMTMTNKQRAQTDQSNKFINSPKRRQQIFHNRVSINTISRPSPTTTTQYHSLSLSHKINGESERAKQPQSKPKQQQILECTCGFVNQQKVLQDNQEPLPPPLPKPVYSVHKRVLPPNLVALSSPQGRQWLVESLQAETAESYWALTEQFINQDDPAFCGVTTLLMVLNAMNIDPNVRWKGGWRFYGDENILLNRCCLNTERIRRGGITMEQFMILGSCHGMRITMKRPAPATTTGTSSDKASLHNNSRSHGKVYSLDDFRQDIRQSLDSGCNQDHSILVTSFSRSALQQTGDGHFSPVAAYHEPSDQLLILDVARFKYAPYWVSVEELYHAMQPLDETTKMPRGWYIMKPPLMAPPIYHEMTTEDRRPAHLVPEAHEAESCPIGKIKVEFCPAKQQASSGSNEGGKTPQEFQ